MKQYVTMVTMESGGYRRVEQIDSQFFALTRLFE